MQAYRQFSEPHPLNGCVPIFWQDIREATLNASFRPKLCHHISGVVCVANYLGRAPLLCGVARTTQNRYDMNEL